MTMVNKPAPSKGAVFKSFKLDRRLLWLAVAALCVALGEFSLRAWEQQQKLETELQRLRRNADVLNASNDGTDWVGHARALESERAGLQARLWQVPSEAQAQARLRDWLYNALRSANVNRPAINLLPLLAAAVEPAPLRPEGTPAALVPRTLRARATVSFELTPSALENALVQIEAGGQLASVDNLSVSSRSRRIEMTVSVPVLLKSTERP
jgi:hypothetical protein